MPRGRGQHYDGNRSRGCHFQDIKEGILIIMVPGTKYVDTMMDMIIMTDGMSIMMEGSFSDQMEDFMTDIRYMTILEETIFLETILDKMIDTDVVGIIETVDVGPMTTVEGEASPTTLVMIAHNSRAQATPNNLQLPAHNHLHQSLHLHKGLICN